MKKIRRRRPIKRQSYRLTDQDKERLTIMYYEGYHPIEMAEAMKISDKTAYKFCSDRFSPVNGGWARGAPSSEERDLIMQRHHEGVKQPMLASAHRRPVWVINRIVNPKPAGIAAIEGAPINAKPGEIFVIPPQPTFLEKVGKFFRRLLGGSH
jgi:hypothetical protein